jgi:hypothetical protein
MRPTLTRTRFEEHPNCCDLGMDVHSLELRSLDELGARVGTFGRAPMNLRQEELLTKALFHASSREIFRQVAGKGL